MNQLVASPAVSPFQRACKAFRTGELPYGVDFDTFVPNIQLELREAHAELAPLIHGFATPDFRMLDSRHAGESAISRGAGIILKHARVSLAERVRTDAVGLDNKPTPSTMSVSTAFGQAYRQARTGKDQQVTIETVVHGAIAERAAGRLKHIPTWAGRAALTLGRTITRDRRNLLTIPGAVLWGAWQLRSRRAAHAVAGNLGDIYSRF